MARIVPLITPEMAHAALSLPAIVTDWPEHSNCQTSLHPTSSLVDQLKELMDMRNMFTDFADRFTVEAAIRLPPGVRTPAETRVALFTIYQEIIRRIEESEAYLEEPPEFHITLARGRGIQGTVRFTLCRDQHR